MRGLLPARDLLQACDQIVLAAVLCSRLLGAIGRAAEPHGRCTRRILALDGETSDRCLRHLRARGRVASGELMRELFAGEITLFDERGLARHLARDGRFAVTTEHGEPMVGARAAGGARPTSSGRGSDPAPAR